MKQRAETKADIEKKIDQCNRRLGRISDGLNELKAASADLENWQRNLSRAEDLSSLPKRLPRRSQRHPAIALPQGSQALN